MILAKLEQGLATRHSVCDQTRDGRTTGMILA
jgi:hypothetical protein